MNLFMNSQFKSFDPAYQLGLDTRLMRDPQLVRVFDIDGVLAIYGYGSDGINVCSDTEFDAFMESHDLYQYARGTTFMRSYLKSCTTPHLNYVLSQSGNEAQDRQKIAFLKREYDGFFPEDHILFTREPDKTSIVAKLLSEHFDGLATPHLCIDDDVRVLDQLQVGGIKAIHVSSLLLLAEMMHSA